MQPQFPDSHQPLDGSLRGFIRDPGFMRIIERDLRTGQHRNPTNKPDYFTTAFFHHPDELKNEVKRSGFRSVKVLALTGFAWLLPGFNHIWGDPTLKARLNSILDRTELEPSMLGTSDHLLSVGKR